MFYKGFDGVVRDDGNGRRWEVCFDLVSVVACLCHVRLCFLSDFGRKIFEPSRCYWIRQVVFSVIRESISTALVVI